MNRQIEILPVPMVARLCSPPPSIIIGRHISWSGPLFDLAKQDFVQTYGVGLVLADWEEYLSIRLKDSATVKLIHKHWLSEYAVQYWARLTLIEELKKIKSRVLMPGEPLFTIYILADPRDNSARYVGMSKNPHMRFAQHMSLDGSNPTKDAWIRELAWHHLQPAIYFYEQVHGRNLARKREQFYIDYYTKNGGYLTNSPSTYRNGGA